jgi:hypothetical protein
MSRCSAAPEAESLAGVLVPNGKLGPVRRHITNGHKLTRMGFSAKEGSQPATALLTSPLGRGRQSRFGIISFFKVNSLVVFMVFSFPAVFRAFVRCSLVLLFVRLPLCTTNHFVLDRPQSVFPSIAPGESRFLLTVFYTKVLPLSL